MDFFYDDNVTQSQYSSSGPNSYRCHVCGSQSFHEDLDTSQKICSTCFTQSQDDIFEVEEDDIEQFGAKRGGGLKMLRSKGERGREKRPLESYDTSKELPDIDICLKGMKAVLANGTNRLTDLMNLSPEASRNAIHVVRELWLAYLRSWTDAAEFFGKKHPTMRFSFRDYFLSSREKLVRRYVAQNVQSNQKVHEEDTEENIKDLNADESSQFAEMDNEESDARKGLKRKLTKEYHEDNDDAEMMVTPNPSTSLKSTTFQQVKNEFCSDLQSEKQLDIDINTKGNKLFSVDQLRYLKTPISKMLQLYLGRKRLKGFKEAALSIVPSMRMVAALLWLAVNGTGISSSQICDWIKSGEIPLMDAYRHLLKNKRQRDTLKFCEPFFQMNYPPSPKILEDLAAILAIACRLEDRKKGSKNESTQSIPIWPSESLPTVIASTVAKTGLDQTVLDRSLALVGIYNQKEKKISQIASLDTIKNVIYFPTLPAPLVTPDAIVRMDDVVAIIAIACQLDPNWRSLQCLSLGKDPLIPWNESQLQPNGTSLESYLNYAEKFVFRTADQQEETFDETVSLLPKQYWEINRELDLSASDDESHRSEVKRSSSEFVRPCRLVAGAVFSKTESNFMPCNYERKKTKLINDNPQKNIYFTSGFTYDFERMDKANRDWAPHTMSDPKIDLLVQYLAYTTQLDSFCVLRKMDQFLNASKKIRQN